MAQSLKTQGNTALAEKPRVIVIEATQAPETVELRVAAYARVSSSSEDQLNSFAAQNRYYTDYITQHDNWKLVDIYADEGITGTSMKKREDFKRMIKDCECGQIDRILVKSVSRFARNSTECLETVRHLKTLGVSVYFEENNIDTGKVSGEMMTSVFAALAQAESEAISGNMRWSYEKRMLSGKFITCKYPFGYRLVNGILEINECEATIVRLIFYRFLSGQSTTHIAAEITKLGILTRDGAALWHHTTICYILQNEKYVGDSLLQKFYVTDSLPYQKRRNNGEKQKFYVRSTHPAIIDRETFEKAQLLLKKKHIGQVASPRITHDFTKMIRCGECGTYYKRKCFNGTIYWVCNKHNSGLSLCNSKQIPETQFQNAFIRLYYKLRNNYSKILCPILHGLKEVQNSRMLWSADVITLNGRIVNILSQEQTLSELKARGLVDSDIYIFKSNALARQLRALKLQKEQVTALQNNDLVEKTEQIIAHLEMGPSFLDQFDVELFRAMIDEIIVDSDSTIRLRLINGLELVEHIERTSR